MLLDWIARRQMAAFEKRFAYDLSYARELLQASRRAFWKFTRLAPMGQHREGVPALAWHAAKIVGARAEDCGPCVQLVVDMARADGVHDDAIAAVLRDDVPAMDAETSLGYRYARAVVTHDAEVLDLRDEVVRRHGPKALASLALGLTASRMFPMLKMALGHGHACAQVRVGAQTVAPALLKNAHHADLQAHAL
jgi:alkylhydroperoxidase family enzyme